MKPLSNKKKTYFEANIIGLSAEFHSLYIAICFFFWPQRSDLLLLNFSFCSVLENGCIRDLES